MQYNNWFILRLKHISFDTQWRNLFPLEEHLKENGFFFFWIAALSEILWSVWIVGEGGGVEWKLPKISLFSVNFTLLPSTPPPSPLNPNKPLMMDSLRKCHMVFYE